MRVKQRLEINVIVMAVTATIILLVLSLSFFSVNKANNIEEIADDLIVNVLERVTLRNDYIRNNNERAKEQWFTKHKQIDATLKLAAEKFENDKGKTTIAELIKINASIEKIFSGIVENREKRGALTGSDSLSAATEDRLLSQLNMKVYEDVSRARDLLDLSREARASALRRGVGSIIFILVIMVVTAVFNSWTTGRAVIGRIGRLHDGASVIGGGNLEYRIDIKGDDEFAELSSAFNAMTAKLQGSYHNLEKEVEERRRAEEALREAHDVLEARVQERTQELKEAEQGLREMNESLEQLVTERTAALQAANASLRNSRRAALNLTEDAIAARHQAEALTSELGREIAERRRAEEEREIAAGFLLLVNESKSTEDLIRTAVGYFREHSGCEAVGVRLKEGDDYPYFNVQGFSREFVRMENSLCTRDETGRPLYDSAGYPVMECMCGNVIQQRFDPAQPFFSARGNFWTNNTTELLAASTEEDWQTRTRNRCNGEGYESVALIAIRAGAAPIGLLQLNDRRPGRFSRERIALWERLAGYLGIALEKFQAEQALLLRGEELQAVNRELESFIYSVSHDLRTPMRSMAIFTNLIANSYADRLDERGKDYFRRVRDAGVKMNRLVEDLLYLSRVSRQEIKRTEFDLSDMATHIIAELREASPGRTVEVDIEKDMIAFADPQLIELVLANLLGNAWKFTLKTDKARIALGVLEREEQTAYYVRDNGAGFDQQYAGKMFHPFQRLHSDDEFEGTGIGLAIVEQAIRRHGGKAWAEGEIGKGATVFFTLA